MENLNVRISGKLSQHVQRQISPHGMYENASEYVRALIRKDVEEQQAAWQWLMDEITPGLLADESEFLEETAEDVIARNERRSTQ